MCDVVSSIMATMSAISAITGIVNSESERQVQEAQAEASDKANMHNAMQAIKEQTNRSNQEGIQQQQERTEIADKRLQLKKENLIERSRAQASSKASGGAYDAVINNYSRINGNNMSALNQQLAMQDINHNIARQNYKDTADARINGLQGYIMPGSNTGMKSFQAALGIGSDALGIYKKYGNNKRS